MVAPHQVGDLVRSFVRVPDSGSDKSVKSTFCDLARASTLAATISVPQNLPPATNVLTQTPTLTPISNSQQRKRSRSEEKGNNDSSSTPKVLHIEESSYTVAPIKIIPAKCIVVMRNSNPDLQKLKEENEQIKNQNLLLRKQISLFKQLLRNPQRLQNILNKIGNK